MRYSLCVSPLINVQFISTDGPDSVCCFLFVREMMGNGENDCTSEGCKLGKARLRTNGPCGFIGIRRKKLKLIISYTLNNVSEKLLFTFLSAADKQDNIIFPLHMNRPFRRDFCAASRAWLFLKWIGWRRGSFWKGLTQMPGLQSAVQLQSGTRSQSCIM